MKRLFLSALLVASGCTKDDRSTTKAPLESPEKPVPKATSSIPAPGSLKRLDGDKKEINLSVLMAGDEADAMIERVYEDTKTKGSTKRTEGAGDAATYTYLPMRLGDIRGWTTRLHLYAFATNADGLGAVFDRYAKHADALLISSTSARERHPTGIQRLTTRGRPIVECGQDGLAPEATTCGKRSRSTAQGAMSRQEQLARQSQRIISSPSTTSALHRFGQQNRRPRSGEHPGAGS